MGGGSGVGGAGMGGSNDDGTLTGNDVAGRDEQLDPAALLALIGEQESRTVQALSVDGGLLYLAWGIALTLGHATMFLSAPGHALNVLPGWMGGATMALALVAAGVITGMHIRRASIGLAGPTQRQAMRWGWSWAVLFFGAQLMGSALARHGADDTVLTLYFTCLPGLITGAMYMAGGALWFERPMFRLGVWLILVFGAAALAGTPWVFLVLTITAGPALILVGVSKRRGVARAGPP